MATKSYRNQAAWQKEAKAAKLEVDTAPVHDPPEGYILVKNAAIAINPVDIAMQKLAAFPVNYPAVLGEDVAGVVAAVGPGVTRFKTGERVLGYATGLATKEPGYGAFQLYTLIKEEVASHIPEVLPFNKATVLPLSLATAAHALFGEPTLKLSYPSLRPKPVSQTVLIWGGSSSVGASAVQLAKAAGYEVITTASVRNHQAVKQLGADKVFDYKHENVVDEVSNFLQGKQLAGVFDASGSDSGMSNSSKIAARAEGNRTVICVRRPPDDVPKEVTAKPILSLSILGTPVSKAIFEEYIPAALIQEAFKVVPEPQVIGRGLDYVQQGLDTLQDGVSFKKVVIEL
ncbi:oxidoreductase [Paramyrothecium foliicola]|nr:oxidoreductase [Paramyrothecium foliicola]